MSNKRIQKLDESVINKIAAGEIIIQPANALKEMLENSIDAGATNIEIMVKDGGLKLLQITDNGHGINLQDLPLLCERFATSKLTNFDDLSKIQTYGFRGEALASISHISRLSVITKTKDSKLAYKAFYLNGQLCNSNFKIGGKIDPKPVAGKDGTQIIVEDLFYNLPNRIKGLRSKSEEFSKILDIVGKYAIHTQHAGFTCKKHGDPLQQLNTRPNLPLKERIRIVYGASIANELLEFINNEKGHDLGLLQMSGCITNANYNNKKKMTPIIFINNRLVSCDPLKRAVNSIFQLFLPKGSNPFFYVSLQIKSENLDVNIHPTKREVRFLNEDEIIEIVVDKIHEILSNVDTSRKFKTQSIISQKRINDEEQQPVVKKYRQENKLVRVDSKQAKINAFLESQPVETYQDSIKKEFTFSQDQILEDEKQEESEERSRDYIQVNLDSIAQLKNEIIEFVDKSLTNIFTHAVFVGIVDSNKRLCCFQYDVKLYLVDYAALLFEFYYQISVNEFSNYGIIKFDEPIDLNDILDSLYENDESLVPKSKILKNLLENKEMLKEYFQIGFNEDNQLISIPIILQDINPSFRKLPFFIYRLGKLDYSIELNCLKNIFRQLALFYLPEPIESDDIRKEDLNSLLENYLFPEIKKQLLATKNLSRDLIQIADLPELYKIFERC
ncbi:unnamed protein product [Candida verbasci]|uniref:DNA mismatch repair protein S5 domain-containing protein n=1 Tax=Candida verbasci TaxID=1227364 RepID=A0A9W4U061_9ASCO|nr:unnamed protein product [Candida verbasci]